MKKSIWTLGAALALCSSAPASPAERAASLGGTPTISIADTSAVMAAAIRGVSTALDSAVQNSVNAGVLYSVAAGNSGANACGSSPARMGTMNGVVTTAALDINDNEASWSNFGSCVDIWAPGVNILSTRRGGGTTTMSGTSMASPHVGGAAAVYLSSNPTASPAAVEDALKSSAVATGTTSKSGAPIKRVCASCSL